MPQIPLYSENSQVATSSPVSLQNVHNAGATGEVIKNIGATVGALSQDYIERKNKLREQADISDYEVMRRNFETELVTKKNDALMNGMNYSDVYDKVVAPEIGKFQEKINSRNYGKNSMNNINSRWSYDSAGIRQKEINDREKMELTDYTERIKSQAEGLLAGGQTDEANTLFNSLEGVIGSGQVVKIKSDSAYKSVRRQSAVNSEAFKTGTLKPEQYIDKQNDLRKSIESNEMLTSGRKDDLYTEMTYQIANVSAAKSKEAKKFETDFRKTIIDGKLDPSWVEKARVIYGDDISTKMKTILSNSLNRVSGTNKDVKELIGMVSSLPSTPTTYGDIVSKASEIGGEYSEEVRELAAIIAGEFVETDATMAYVKYGPSSGAMFSQGDIGKYETTYNGWVADVHKSIVDTVNVLHSDSQSEGKAFAKAYQTKIKALIKFASENPNPDKDQLQTFTDGLLNKDASDIVHSLNRATAPQESLDLLYSDPEKYKELFKSNYHYLPEGL